MLLSWYAMRVFAIWFLHLLTVVEAERERSSLATHINGRGDLQNTLATLPIIYYKVY